MPWLQNVIDELLDACKTCLITCCQHRSHLLFVLFA